MDKFIDIDGQKVHYTESGDPQRPPLVLMHGWGCNTTTLASIENAAQDLCHVYNIDFPGFGKSPEPDGVWGVEEYTQLVEKWLKAIGVENPILLGHSFGGRVGILYSSRNPVSKLILVDAAGIKPKRTLKYYYKVYTFKLLKFLAPILLGKKQAQELIERRRGKSGSSDYANSTPKMRAILSKVVNEDLKKVMPQITAPTLLIWGEKDTATPLRDAKMMEKLIPGGALVSFPGCGHYSFLDNPVQFRAVLRSFLSA
ncbi:MAG: alpha/beta hydrolase [Bacteroidales bacterium]|nr:alpha/beta hydrolase [Bacteroidales bacterium]